MRIARVFPRKTKMSPIDPDAYFGNPQLMMPHYDEVHVSVLFTWDLERAGELLNAWNKVAPTRMGGPACGDKGDVFIPRMYIKSNVVITSRGCPNHCPWCFVPQREGKIRELPITEGNIIQDNNLLACSSQHIDRVFSMLSHHNRIEFPGGLEAARVTDSIVDKLRNLRIYQLWLAYDSPNQEKILVRAVNKLSKYFSRNKLRCYVLIGYEGDTLANAEARLRHAYELGTLPYAMRYRTPSTKWEGTYLFKERSWNLLARQWTRPAIIKSIMKHI